MATQIKKIIKVSSSFKDPSYYFTPSGGSVSNYNGEENVTLGGAPAEVEKWVDFLKAAYPQATIIDETGFTPAPAYSAPSFTPQNVEETEDFDEDEDE